MTDPGPAASIDSSAPPSGTGCLSCEAGDGPGWWFHLRRCASCGAVLRSFEPGEDWFWDARTSSYVDGPALAPPQSRPASQPAPGPAGKVPADWQRQLH